MIYLLDNKKERQEVRYNIDSFHNYQDIFKIKNVVNDVNSTPFLDNASCIIFHASFPTKGLLMKIRNEYDDTPKVFFSNDYKIVKFVEKDFIQEIRADILYQNLRYFLDDYRITNTPNLKILAFGENYRQAEVSKLKDIVYYALFDYDYETTFQSDWLDETVMNVIKELHNLAFSGNQFDEYHANIVNSNYSVGQFLTKIDTLAQKIK
jgi:hypothetical protein